MRRATGRGRRAAVIAAFFVAAALGGGERAWAGEAAAPAVTPYVKRGMMFGPGQAGLTLDLASRTGGGRPGASATLIAAFGITSRLTFEGSLGTLTFSPEIAYRSPTVGLWLGLVDTLPFELDTAARLTFGVPGEQPVREIEPGVVAVFHAGDLLRVDVGGHLPITGDGLRSVGLRVPVQLAVQVSPFLDLALRSGVTLGEGPPAVPLGLAVGCTLPFERGGYAVVTPSVTWPRFVGAEGGWPGPVVLEVALSLVTP